MMKNNEHHYTDEEYEQERLAKIERDRLKYEKKDKPFNPDTVKIPEYKDLRLIIKKELRSQCETSKKYYHSNIVEQAVDEAKATFIKACQKAHKHILKTAKLLYNHFLYIEPVKKVLQED